MGPNPTDRTPAPPAQRLAAPRKALAPVSSGEHEHQAQHAQAPPTCPGFALPPSAARAAATAAIGALWHPQSQPITQRPTAPQQQA